MVAFKRDSHWVTPFDMEKYYVYAYFDVNGDVFYIGKGKGYRVNNHLKPSNLKSNSHKNNKIKTVLKQQGFVKRDILAYFDSESSAYAFEESLISYYGLERLTNVLAKRDDFPDKAVVARSRLDTPDEVFISIKDKFLLGVPIRTLSEEFNLTPKYIENVLKGRKKSYLGLKDACSHLFKTPIKHLTEDDKLSAETLANKGLSYREIAEQLQLNPKAVNAYLTYNNIKPVVRKRLSQDEVDEILGLRLSGKSYSEIVKITRKPKTTVARVCTSDRLGTVGNGTGKSVAAKDTNASNLNKN